MRCTQYLRLINFVGLAALSCSSNQAPTSDEDTPVTAAPSGGTVATPNTSAAGAAAPKPVGTGAAGTPAGVRNVGGAGQLAVAGTSGGAGSASTELDADAGIEAGGAAGSGEVPPTQTSSAFDQCVSGLQAMCGYDQKMVACSSLMSAVIPLTNGST
jgi:hypothetical protein